MSRTPVITLQPDQRGIVNNVNRMPRFGELLGAEIENAVVSEYGHHVGDFTGHGVTGRAIEIVKRGDGPKDSSAVVREGGLVLPFERHLLGEYEHAFSADTRIFPALISEAELREHGQPVGVIEYDDQLGLPIVSKDFDYGAVIGVVRAYVDVSARRTYTGTKGSSYLDTRAGFPNTAPYAIVVVQYEGRCRIRMEDAPTIEDGTDYLSPYVYASSGGDGFNNGGYGIFVGRAFRRIAPFDEADTDDDWYDALLIPAGTVPTRVESFAMYKIDQTNKQVSFHGGHIHHGQNAYSVSDAVVSVVGGTSGDPVQAILEYEHGVGGTILPSAVASTDDDPPPQSNGYTRVVLQSFFTSNDKIVPKYPSKHTGTLFLGATYADA